MYMSKKWVYLFTEGNSTMRDLLGGKGAGMGEMTRTGVPVPPGFTITTEACNAYYDGGKKLPEGLWEQARVAMLEVEKVSGKKFGDATNPLLVSVRSGARESMPGMMDTVLNLGLNAQTLEGLAKQTGNPRFAADAYRRFVQLFGKIVLGADGEKLEHVMNEAKGKNRTDTDLSAAELTDIANQFKVLIKQDTGHDFPEDPNVQLEMAIMAVFNSWMGRRAIDYRRIEKIPDNIGTGVNVQTMVFGNMGDDSATGVAFTRNPATGENEMFGEYLVNAQGEDVVAGIRTPKPITEMAKELPKSSAEFLQIARKLEAHYKDVQDVEFTIERGKLWMLQTRTASAPAWPQYVSPLTWSKKASSTRRPPSAASSPKCSTNSSSRLLMPNRPPLPKSSPPAWLPALVLPVVRSALTPIGPLNGPKRAKWSFWYVPKPPPKTSTVWSPLPRF
jgi:pyruvate, orthophosphate dikinase